MHYRLFPTMSDNRISRRETLKRAAGALALSLGAPAALAASDDRADGSTISFFDGKSNRGRPVFEMEIPDEIAAMLQGDAAFENIKIKYVRGRDIKMTAYRVRPMR